MIQAYPILASDVSANFMISWFLNLSNSFYQTYDLFISATSPNWISPLFLDHCTSAEYLFNVICAFIPASLSIQDHHTTTTSNKWRGVKVTRFSPRWVWGRIHCTFICTYNVQCENVYHDKNIKKSMHCYITYYLIRSLINKKMTLKLFDGHVQFYEFWQLFLDLKMQKLCPILNL